MNRQFNCLYRWHATTSQADEQWITQSFEQLFKGKSFNSVSICTVDVLFHELIVLCQVTVADFKQMAKEVQAQEPDITHWTFGKYVLALFLSSRMDETHD